MNPILAWHNLFMRIVTGEAQQLSWRLFSVRQSFARNIQGRFQQRQYQGVSPAMFVDMDTKAVYSDAKSKYTVHPVDKNTVPVRRTGSAKKQMAVCVSVASDENNNFYFEFIRANSMKDMKGLWWISRRKRCMDPIKQRGGLTRGVWSYE